MMDSVLSFPFACPYIGRRQNKTKKMLGNFLKQLCVQEPTRPGKLIHSALNLDAVFYLSAWLSEWSILAVEAYLRDVLAAKKHRATLIIKQ